MPNKWENGAFRYWETYACLAICDAEVRDFSVLFLVGNLNGVSRVPLDDLRPRHFFPRDIEDQVVVIIAM